MYAQQQQVHQQPMKTPKGPTQEEKKAQYYEICSQVVPTISEAIDRNGGFCSLAEVVKDPAVMAAMETIPAGFSKKIKSVTDLFPDFISYFDGGRVATAKGYEDGLVNADGTINNVKKANKKREKPEPDMFAPSGQEVTHDFSYIPPETNTVANTNEVPVHNFGMMGKKLQDACMHGTDEYFAAVMEEARQYRYNQSTPAQEDAKAVIADCVQRAVQANKKPTLNFLTTRPEIVELQPVIGRKLKKFLEQHPDTFTIREELHENGVHKDQVVDVAQEFFSRPAPNRNHGHGARPAPQQQPLKAPSIGQQGGKGGKHQNQQQAVAAPQIYRPGAGANGFGAHAGKGGKSKGKGMDAKRLRVA